MIRPPRFTLALLVLLAAASVAIAAEFPCGDLYARGTNWFAATYLYKPSDRQELGPAWNLAPLLIQEVAITPKGSGPLKAGFGAIGMSNGVPTLDATAATVYWKLEGVHLRGKAHSQILFLWCYAAERVNSATNASVALQGIRITLNGAGRPVIWEVLSDSGGCEQIYVSASLEAAAASEFGKPLAGRVHAIERATNETPHVVVSRVIEDGPTVAGPIVYLMAGSHDVTTLICRCMPSQAKELLGNGYYRLAELDPGTAHILGEIKKRTGASVIPFWASANSTARSLERLLRLPADF